MLIQILGTMLLALSVTHAYRMIEKVLAKRELDKALDFIHDKLTLTEQED